MQQLMFIHYSKPSLFQPLYLVGAFSAIIKKKMFFAKLVSFKGASGVQVGGKLIITTSSRQAGTVGWGVWGRCIMPLPLLALHGFRTPVLFILRDCGLMRNDESREAAEWVGVHMLRSTGNPPAPTPLPSHAHTHSRTPACLHVPVPPALEKP